MHAVSAARLDAAGAADARTELTTAAAELAAATRLGVAEALELEVAREEEVTTAGAEEVEV